MELLNKLGIDWKLLIAQAVNFFILLIILYKFVYKPVLDMMERRSKTIEKGVHDAKEAEERLVHIEKMREEKMLQTERKIGEMLEHARQEAEGLKKDLAVAAQSQADDLLRRSRAQLAEEKEKMIQDVKREIAAFVVQASGKLMEREFSAADQKRLSEAVSKEMTSIEATQEGFARRA